MGFKSKEEIDYQKQPVKTANGGIELIDAGSGKLRDKRPSDFHGPDCACLHCRRLCCLLCHQEDPSITETRTSLAGFGRHVQMKHPSHYSFKPSERRAKRLAKQLQELQVAKQIKRFERQGLRRIPLKQITEGNLKTLSEWTKNAKHGASANGGKGSDPLLLKALEFADEGFKTQKVFEASVRRLAMEVERGVKTGTYTTTARSTHFDPRVAVELLKLCFALGKGWSFCVHLILLYGLDAFATALATEGVSPPTHTPTIPNPAQIVNAAAPLAREILAGDAEESNFQ